MVYMYIDRAKIMLMLCIDQDKYIKHLSDANLGIFFVRRVQPSTILPKKKKWINRIKKKEKEKGSDKG